MADKKTKFMVGLFMTSGIGIGLIAVIWLGMSHFFEEGMFYATYLDQSVQGLDVDSPVKYRGVSIGRVERIQVAPDSRLIKVIMKIDSGINLENDMVAQLKVVGITGSMFIEVDRTQPGEPDFSPHLNFPSEYPIIASKPSDISKLVRGLDDVIQEINTVDLEGISDKTKNMLDAINQSMVDLDLAGISEDLKLLLDNINKDFDSERWIAIIEEINKSAQHLESVLKRADTSFQRVNTLLTRFDGIVDKNEGTIHEALEEFKLTVQNTNRFVSNAGNLVDRTGDHLATLSDQLLTVGQNLEEASINLNRGLSMASSHPSQILFGEPPPARRIKFQDPQAHNRE